MGQTEIMSCTASKGQQPSTELEGCGVQNGLNFFISFMDVGISSGTDPLDKAKSVRTSYGLQILADGKQLYLVHSKPRHHPLFIAV